MSQITIYHNPQCGTSRNTLELIRNSGEEPTVIEYLQTPPDRTTLVRLIKDMGIEVRALLRVKGTPYEELELGDTSLTDDQLIDTMMAHPMDCPRRRGQSKPITRCKYLVEHSRSESLLSSESGLACH